MSTISLGAAPLQLTVTLVRGADFVQQLTRKDGTPWPTDAQVTLELIHADTANTRWDATLSESTAVWNVDTAEVEATIAKRIRGAKLWYVQGELKVLWGMGDADIQGV